MDKKIQLIEIDPKGKYILAIQHADMDFVKLITQELRDWWDSDQPFIVLYSTGEEEIKLYKAKKDATEE